MPVISLDPARKAAIDKAMALAVVDDWFEGQIAEGFATPGGWRMGLTTTDVTLLTGNYVLAQQADAVGADLPPLVDMDGVARTIADLEELTGLMLAYGQHRAALSTEYASRKAAIESPQE